MDDGTKVKPTIPDVLDRFAAYFRLNPAWGSLHIVLDDGNVGDDSVRWCLNHARETGDEEGAVLAEILLSMSQTQRRKLDPLVFKSVSQYVPGRGWLVKPAE